MYNIDIKSTLLHKRSTAGTPKEVQNKTRLVILNVSLSGFELTYPSWRMSRRGHEHMHICVRTLLIIRENKSCDGANYCHHHTQYIIYLFKALFPLPAHLLILYLFIY
jgi:hypothetical protein